MLSHIYAFLLQFVVVFAIVWGCFKNNIEQHEYPKELQAHPAKKGEIPDTRNTR